MKSEPLACVLMCHSAEAIPAIAGAKAAECASTTQAMRQAAQHIVDRKVEVLVVVSPCTARHQEAFGLVSGSSLQGDLSQYGQCEFKVEMRNDAQAAKDLQAMAVREQLSLIDLPALHLDVGALVPLWFLHEAGFTGRILLCSLPMEPGRGPNRSFGNVVAKTAASSTQPWGLVVAGNLSRQAAGRALDDQVVKALGQADLRQAVAVPEAVRALAGETVLDGLEIACAAVDFNAQGFQLLSYQAPFGVGLLVTILA